jgi:UDP-N-acetylmuramoylalanine--D-glutamate ligase
MARAVERALREAGKGETLLLSPGAASFDQFENFGRRGEVFAALVKQEGQKKK